MDLDATLCSHDGDMTIMMRRWCLFREVHSCACALTFFLCCCRVFFYILPRVCHFAWAVLFKVPFYLTQPSPVGKR